MCGEDVYVNWASNRKTPKDVCTKRVHVYGSWSKEVKKNVICQCGKTRWVHVKCKHCGLLSGKAITIK